MTSDDAEELLLPVYQELRSLGLLRHKSLSDGVKRMGGLVKSQSYDVDSYIAHKSVEGESVSLSIIQEKGGQPFLIVQRRRKEGRSMPDVVVDQFSLDQFALAKALFLTNARLISEAPGSWRAAHPKDLLP